MKCLFTHNQCRCGFTSCYYSNTMLIEKVIHLDWCDEDLKATPNGVDIWGKDWHCYFTWEAAMREAKSQGLRLPTKDEWEQSLGIIWKLKLFNFLKLEYWYYRNYHNGQYNTQCLSGYYWSATQNITRSYCAYFRKCGGHTANSYNRAYGFSVRCLKN